MVNVTKPNVSLVVKMGQRPFIVNGSDAEVRLKKGLVVCSFGKGKFKLRELSEENSADGSILFHIQSPADEAFQGLGNQTWNQTKQCNSQVVSVFRVLEAYID